MDDFVIKKIILRNEYKIIGNNGKLQNGMISDQYTGLVSFYVDAWSLN